MPTIIAYRTTIGLLWGLALWHSWESRGLFVDGSAFLVQIARREWFFDFYAPRLYAMVVGQIPVMTALFLGVTDLHLMARLLSFGLFAVPTALYHLALMRAKDDAVLLAAVVAAIAVVFMTTSFFIVGEYNTAYALAVLVAVRLVTAERLTVFDGLVLAAIAFLAMRTYEVMIYLGPLLAAMIFWALRRAPSRPVFATALHVAAAGMFLAGMVVATGSILRPYSEEHLSDTVADRHELLAEPAVRHGACSGARGRGVGTGQAARPAGDKALSRGRPRSSSSSPCRRCSRLSDTLVRPLAKSQYVARTAAGLVIAAIVVFIWTYRSKVGDKLPALRHPAHARRGTALRRLCAV